MRGHPCTPVLIDTSAWVQHLRSHDAEVERLIAVAAARGHVDVAGELAMGSPPGAVRIRDRVLALPRVPEVDPIELMRSVEGLGLPGRGIGWIDAGLLVACHEARCPISIYTRDRRMAEVAISIGVAVHAAREGGTN